MKYSIYTSIINIEGKHTLLYNALSGKFVIIRDKIVEHINTIPPDILNENFPSLYQQMIGAEIIIDDVIDEFSILQKRISHIDNNIHEFILHINPTLDCNFRCWYCYENHVPHSRMKEDMVLASKLYIDSVFQQNKLRSFSLGFFGGEPLFHFNNVAKEIITHTAEVCVKSDVNFQVSFTSTGALITDEIVQFLSHYSCTFQITLDGGNPEHDKTRYSKNGEGSFDLIVSNVKRLIHSGIKVIVRVNYTSANIDSVKTVFDSFRNIPSEDKEYISFDFQRVWQDRNENIDDDTEEKIGHIREIFRTNDFIVGTNYILHGVADSCYGDKINHLLINYNGDVFGCTARDFTKQNRIGYLNSNGVVYYDTEKVEKRNNSKLAKPVCKTCRIAPLCCGGCKQRAMESLGDNECSFGYTEEKKDKIILDIFEYSFMRTK